MDAPENTSAPSRWVSKYLNTRYFRFPPDITLRAREGWEHPRADTNRNVLRRIVGQSAYLREHAESSGQIELLGATAHWWVLRDEGALQQNSGSIQSSGHVAALYQDELYEMQSGRGGMARLQQFGVVLGYNRVVIYIEPRSVAGSSLTTNTARTVLLVDGESLPWAFWASEFRGKMPAQIEELMAGVAAGSKGADHRQSIRDRLKQIRDLFKLSKYRPSSSGDYFADVDATSRGGVPQGREPKPRQGRTPDGGPGGRTGNLLALYLADAGTPAERVRSDEYPEARWISVSDGTRVAPDLEDRAARYLADQNLLLINADFRVFADMIERWAGQYSSASARLVIEETVREWFEQNLVECVMGIQHLRNEREWSIDDMERALSEEALTGAVMPRYHVDVAIKRGLGSRLGTLREQAS